MDCLPLLYIGLTTGICILFIVTCLLVSKFFNYEYVDINGIKESSSYKTIYESEITPSNNFLLVSSSKTPFQNPFYMLLVDKKKGYLYEHDNNYKTTSDKETLRLNDADEKSFRFAHDVENLERSNQAVPVNKDKSVNESVKKNKNTTFDKDNSTNIPDKKKTHFDHDDSDDIKYIYQGKNDIVNDIGTSDKKKKLNGNVDTVNDCKSQTDTCLNTLDACCSAMTFKQIETIMQTDSIAFIDRKTYRNCSTCMSRQYVGQTNVYASTSAPKCLAKCSQVDSEVLGTRKAFKNRCTSVVEIKQVEQWIQTEPVVSKIKIESDTKSISTRAVHENSDEKCEICRLKRIIDEIDMKLEKDKIKPSAYASSSKIYAQNKIQFSVTSKKPAKVATQVKPKKTASRKSSNIECDCPNKNVVTESTFDKKNKLHELSQQAQSYLERARKLTRYMKENDPTIDHYRTVKKDIFNGLSLSSHTSKIEINTVYDRNSSKSNSKYETDTLYDKKSQTEVRIKNLIPKMDITIKSPNKNLKHSKIRVKTKQTTNDHNEDISSRNKVYCQPCNSAKSTIRRAAVINSKTKISLSRNKLQINQSSNMIGVSQCSSQECLGQKYSRVTFDDDKQIQNLSHAQRKTKIFSQTNYIPQTTVKYARALHPRYNIKPSPSKNIAPMYFRETISRAGYLKAPTYNMTQVLPSRNEKMCENICYKNAGLTGNCGQVNSTGYYTCSPLQSSSIRSSQIYPQCLQKKTTQSTCYNCNLGLTSGKLCRCVKNYNDYPRWR